jgi:hypothetical protein
MTGDAALTAMYDQAKAAGDEKLDVLLNSIRRHTAGNSPAMSAVTVSLVLTSWPEDLLREVLHAALIRLAAEAPDAHR